MKLSELISYRNINEGDKISFYHPRHVIVKEVHDDHIIVYDPAFDETFPLSYDIMDDTHNFEFIEPTGLDKPIEDLELTGRAMNGLRRISGLKTIRDLTKFTREMLRCIPGVGEKTVKEIESVLNTRRTSLNRETLSYEEHRELLSRIKD